MKDRVKKGTVWHGLRIGFWIMIAFWIFFTIFPNLEIVGFILFIDLVWVIITIYTFVNSIVHLTKYKPKSFAITALVISSILMISILIGFIQGIISGLAVTV